MTGAGVMTGAAGQDREPFTTSGTIAVANLHAQLDALPDWFLLVDLLLLRGHVLGHIADYERAAKLAAQLVLDAPDDGTAWLARARTQRSGLDRPTLEAERAVILQATGYYAQARELHRRAAQHQAGFPALGALAVLHAERGEAAEAERLFTQARRHYRSSSPFPLASLDYRRGLMWYRRGDLAAARAWFEASRRRVPAYAPVLGRLAEIDAAQGAHQAAIDRLRPVAACSDDPEYAARLARALSAVGRGREAAPWHAIAAARYEELAVRHPEAFAGHAADFRLGQRSSR
jgi:tetratricopeptide (TPR) repeat protein